MHTTLQLIELAKQRLAAKHGLPLPMTDYRLGKLMELSPQVIAGWKNGSRTIGTKFARKFADACDLSPEYVYACTQAERADNADEISLLTRIAAAFKETRVAGWIVAAMVATGMSFAPAGNQASAADFSISRVTDYAPRRRARRRAPLATVKSWLRFFTIFPAVTLATGCAALQTPEERAWLAVHVIDAAQTYRIAQDDCFRESDPLTSRLIGETPSRGSVVAWSVGTAAVHAGVTELLLRSERPGLAKWWNYLTIGNSAAAAYHNWHIGIRIGSPNQAINGCREDAR